ncbi:MAG: DsbA family protein [Candidatus Pacebacteria bacterium]|nr:DsbA family protein [Candidatus Paceibacterota bacterium]
MKQTANPYLTPLAIVIAGAFIAGGLYFSSGGSTTPPAAPTYPAAAQPTAPAEPEDTTNLVRAVDERDHILGDPDAPIKVVEYSDFECPFCKRFHATMYTIVEDNPDVAWVYRQFPLESLHPVKARAAALASECAAELGGNDGFWTFADRYLELSPSNNRTDVETLIPRIVDEMGLDRVAFNDCYESNRHDARIQEDIENAIATGGRGTPWSIIVTPNGTTLPVNGALPLPSVQQLIDAARQQ